MSSRKELAGVRIDICSLREALHKIEHYIQEDGLHAVEAVSMKTVVTAGEEEEVRQCLEDIDLVIPSDKEIFLAQHRKMLNVRLWFGVGTENTFTEKKKKTAGLCKRLLARRKMKRQIQSYEAEGEEKVN